MTSIKEKRAAMELSISTIVVVVLAMSMLILGLVLVKNIFFGVNENVDEITNKVKGEIGKLFTEDRKVVVYLSNYLLELKQGDTWGVAFGIKNQISEQEFKYEVKLADPDAGQKCGISQSAIQDWVIAGESGTKAIGSGKVEYGLIRFKIPDGQVKDVSKCIVRFDLVVKKADGSAYSTESFDVQVN